MAVKGAASFLGSLMQIMEQCQNWVNGAKESFLPSTGTVLNEAAKGMKQGGSGKKKSKNDSVQSIKGRIQNKEEDAFE